MPRSYDILADMLLLKSCIGVVGKVTASLRFPKTAIQKIFQIFYTKVYGSVRAWLVACNFTKKVKYLEQIRKLRNAFHPKTYKTFSKIFLGFH